MKITRMRKTEIQELDPEQVPLERAAMEDIEGGTITMKKDLNSYEESLAKKNQVPFVVKTLDILVVE